MKLGHVLQRAVGTVLARRVRVGLDLLTHGLRALIRAQQGDVESGLVFTGEYIHKIEEILPVKEIFERLLREAEAVN